MLTSYVIYLSIPTATPSPNNQRRSFRFPEDHKSYDNDAGDSFRRDGDNAVVLADAIVVGERDGVLNALVRGGHCCDCADGVSCVLGDGDGGLGAGSKDVDEGVG